MRVSHLKCTLWIVDVIVPYDVSDIIHYVCGGACKGAPAGC